MHPAQSWEYAHILGNMDVMFDDNGDIIACAIIPLLLVGENLGKIKCYCSK